MLTVMTVTIKSVYMYCTKDVKWMLIWSKIFQEFIFEKKKKICINLYNILNANGFYESTVLKIMVPFIELYSI